MKIREKRVAMFAAFCLLAGAASAATGKSAAFPVDLREGDRVSAGTEELTFSNLWDGGDGAMVTIAENGAVVADGLSGEGTRSWSVQKTGEYTLTHTTYTNGVAGKVETATFVVPGPELTFEYDGGPFVGGKVTINGNLDGWTIYYTLDGSTPTTESLKYTGPFTLSSAANLKAYAVSDSGMSTPLIENNYAVVERARIENVRARQRWPWNGKVDIDCKVSGIYETIYRVKFAIFAVDRDLGNTNKVSHFWVVRDGVNSNDRVVHTNGEYRLVWDARADLGEAIYSNMVVSVSLVEDVHNGIQLWDGGPYWAETNIGANEPWEYGYYFWWGDVVGCRRENNVWIASDGSSSDYSFKSINSPTCSKSIDELKKLGWIITEANVLAPEHDAAQVQWGTGWRMPRYQELKDLCNNCSWTWTVTNGVAGYVVRSEMRGYESCSIFLPAGGYGYGTSLYDTDLIRGHYWSSVPRSNDIESLGLYFYSRGVYADGANNRYVGRFVRPVKGGLDNYKVTYLPGTNGSGTQLETSKLQDVALVLKGAIFMRNGYKQIGWATKDGGEKVYDLGASYDMNAGITLYPFWTVATYDKVQLWAGGPYWAETNIGAKLPWESGNFFWWGDSVGYKLENGIWCASDGSRYNFSFSYKNTPTFSKDIPMLQSEGWITAEGYINVDYMLSAKYDAAQVQLGGGWRMPTHDEFRNLNSECDWIWTVINGRNGYIVCGRGDFAPNSIFLPCAGYCDGTMLHEDNFLGEYQSSTPMDNDYGSWDCYFRSGQHGSISAFRWYGMPIRPVQSFSN